jgi:hypothetical protein
MDLRELEFWGVGWIHLALDRGITVTLCSISTVNMLSAADASESPLHSAGQFQSAVCRKLFLKVSLVEEVSSE